MKICTLLILPLLHASGVLAQASNDATLEAGSIGGNVVDMTVSKIDASCIFPEDKGMLKRLAYVESMAGFSAHTFRTGYYGGIWQVDEAMLQETQQSSSVSVLLPYIQDVQTTFGISWSALTWNDLEKPFFSGLAARMYIQLKLGTNPTGIPRDIAGQASLWTQINRPSRDPQDYITSSDVLETTCSNPKGPDMVFVVDGSGSVGRSNFDKCKTFLKDIVSAADVGGDGARFGVIQFSTGVVEEFDLSSYDTKSEVLAAIDRISYQAGWTYTYSALDELCTTGFRNARAENLGHPRVAILLTDGVSQSQELTLGAAARCHANTDITIFTIGVGSNMNYIELDGMASSPKCVHTFLLDGFLEMNALTSAIEKRTCNAPVIYTPTAPGSGWNQNNTLPGGGHQNCKINVGVGGITIKLVAWTGTVIYYLSMTTYPSDSFYDVKISSSGATDVAVIFVPQSAGQNADAEMFCNVKGDENTDTDYGIQTNTGDQDFCKDQPCQNNGNCADDGSSFICTCAPGYTGSDCSTAPVLTPAPTPAPTTTTTPAPPTCLKQKAKFGGYGLPVEPVLTQMCAFTPLQCNTEHCYCVRPKKGKPMYRKRKIPLPSVELFDCSFSPTGCLRDRFKVLVKEQSPDYIPQCDAGAPKQYQPKQCNSDRSECWCVKSGGALRKKIARGTPASVDCP